MSALSKSAAIALVALLSASVFSFTPVVVRAVNTPIATADAFPGSEGASLVVPAPGVLANDDDGDGGGFIPLTAVTLIDPPSIPGVFSLGNDGSVSFTPTDADFNGVVTFTYTVTDDEAFTSSPATVTMSIGAVNDAPSAQDQSVETAMNVATSGVLVASDIDGGALTYGVVALPASGTLTIDQSSGTFTYMPDTNYSGSDSFTWEAFDGTASSSVATVSVTVVSGEATLALCSNGTDNDNDGLLDLEDMDCASFVPQIGLSIILVSDNGGAGKIEDITILYDGATTTGATTTSTVGAHTIHVSNLNAYVSSTGGDCAEDGTIQLVIGDSAHCTVTYDDKPIDGGGTPGPGKIDGLSNGPISDIGPSFGTISNFSGSVLGASTTTASTTLPELPVGCTPMLTGFFRKEKMENDLDQVKKLQQFLNEKIEANLPLTGEFGPGTDAAVKQFQTKYAEQILSPWGITVPTGFVYLTTQRWINLMSCASLDIPMPKLVPYQG